MGLIEDAKALATRDPFVADGAGQAICFTCEVDIDESEGGSAQHAPWCLWLSMPRVVQALEAAQRVAAIYRDLRDHEGRMDHSVEEWEALEALSEAMEERAG